MREIFSHKFFIFYLFIIICLLFYSYTQVDLGLVLSHYYFFYNIQRSFQNIGYFNRPLSTFIYVFIIIMLFLCYFVTLFLIKKKKLDRKTLWRFILLISVILLFSYAAFSYDIFNYIFDARIFTHYGQNPYQHKALDFPNDPMLSFMHWTHRTYPYGPIWLGVTIPLSYIGMSYFVLTFFLFKLLAVGSFLGAVYYLEKILKKISPQHALFNMAFFALNPLIIIECLVSAHNDIVMMFLAIMSLYLLIQKKYIWSFLILVLSIGVKFATAFVVPIFLAIATIQVIKGRVPWKASLLTAIGCMFLAVVAASQQSGNFQPWYILFVFPFISLIAYDPVVFLPTVIVSLGALGVYIPFLYSGNWDPPIPGILHTLYISTIAIAVIAVIGTLVKDKIPRLANAKKTK